MNFDRYLSVVMATSVAVGILLSTTLALTPVSALLFLFAALLCIVAFVMLQRGMPALVALCAFFCLMGILRTMLPPLSLIPERLSLLGVDVSQSLAVRLHSSGLSPSAESLVSAMLLGNRTGLSPDILQLYRQTGASHILALSGLHLSILFGSFNFFILRLLRSRLRYVLGILGILLIWTYALLVGFPVSLCRASLMMSLLLISEITFAGQVSWNLFGITALFLLLSDPYTLFDVGFQLSFGAVAGIFLFYGPLRDTLQPRHWLLRWLWQGWCVSLSAQAFTLPLLFHYFGYFSLSGVFFSPVYILLATFIMFSALLFLLYSWAGVGSLLMPIVEIGVAIQHGLMSQVASVPWGRVQVDGLSWASVLLIYFALFCLLPPLQSLCCVSNRPEGYRLAMFFRTWPYLTAVILLITVAYVIG